MEKRLRELMGHQDIWLFLKSSNGWLKDVEILDIDSDIVTFRYQNESNSETKVWEKTTKLKNILEIDVRVAAIPKCEQKLQDMRNRFTRLMEQE